MVAKRHKLYSKLESLPIPKRLIEELTIDFIIGLLEARYSKELYNIILVIMDRFSKYSLFFPVYSDIIAAELATLFYNKIEL